MSTSAPAAIVSLWRYPVKSMMGEELNAADVTERGVLGDRAYALVEAGRKDFIELGWIGRTLTIGPEVRLSVAAPCPRCVMTTLPQGDLPYDPGILCAIARHTPRMALETLGEFSANVGVYARVLRGGTIRRGDFITLGS